MFVGAGRSSLDSEGDGRVAVRRSALDSGGDGANAQSTLLLWGVWGVNYRFKIVHSSERGVVVVGESRATAERHSDKGVNAEDSHAWNGRPR